MHLENPVKRLFAMLKPPLISTGLPARSCSAAQMAIKEPDHHIECIFRLRNICVVKESVKETFPYVEFRFYAELHQLLIRIECGAQLKVARPRDDQGRREFR